MEPTAGAARGRLGVDKLALDGRVYGHRPILCEEVVEALQVQGVAAPVLVDATFGRGGHTRRLLQVPGAKVFALDVDPAAVAEARRMEKLTVLRLGRGEKPIDDDDDDDDDDGDDARPHNLRLLTVTTVKRWP